MHIEQIRDFCLSLQNVEESFPFGPDTLVFKSNGKMFLLIGLDNQPLQMNIKCNPEKALELREVYPAVQPGYHMNKKHWNTIRIDGTIPWKIIKEWILDSYELVIGKK